MHKRAKTIAEYTMNTKKKTNFKRGFEYIRLIVI